MTNNQVVELFLNKRKAKSLHMFSDGHKIWSYNTVVAQWEGETLIFNQTKYSRTTSKQVGGLRAVRDKVLTRITVPFNTQDLKNYF